MDCGRYFEAGLLACKIIFIHSYIVVYKTRLAILDAESTLNAKNAIIFSSLRSENIIPFFTFKVNSASRMANLVLYTTYEMKKKYRKNLQFKKNKSKSTLNIKNLIIKNGC